MSYVWLRSIPLLRSFSKPLGFPSSLVLAPLGRQNSSFFVNVPGKALNPFVVGALFSEQHTELPSRKWEAVCALQLTFLPASVEPEVVS